MKREKFARCRAIGSVKQSKAALMDRQIYLKLIVETHQNNALQNHTPVWWDIQYLVDGF